MLIQEVYEKRGIPLDPREGWNPIMNFRYELQMLLEEPIGDRLQSFLIFGVACSLLSVGLNGCWEQRSWRPNLKSISPGRHRFSVSAYPNAG